MQAVTKITGRAGFSGSNQNWEWRLPTGINSENRREWERIPLPCSSNAGNRLPMLNEIVYRHSFENILGL
jgi:hypothetical protein